MASVVLPGGMVRLTAGRVPAGGLAGAASLALALVGAATVTAGSAMPWATFYRGLVERNGLAGDGAYMVGMAVASALASVLAMRRPLAPLRWVALVAGVAIVALALRDLRNIHRLEADPAAAAYFVDAGDGLLVVMAGGALLGASALLSAPAPERGATMPVVLAFMCVAATGMLVAGAIGEYHLHAGAGGHAQHHTSVTQPAHVLTLAGIAFALVASTSVVRLAAGRTGERGQRGSGAGTWR